jgi:uncharacterized protein (DUF362 family)/ferredoxin
MVGNLLPGRYREMQKMTMDNRDFTATISVKKALSSTQVRKAVFDIFEQYESLLPKNRNATIIIKPNLNSNMNALTGNTTDLRVLASVIHVLKSRGYAAITLAEGTNSGFYRQGINVISRLKVDKLAQAFGVQFRDTNYDDVREIHFEGKEKAGVAKTFIEADFFINIPKLKMHYETEMSVCCKSLIGCLAGMKNKQRTHFSLIKNICNLNESIKPDLQIIDAVIAMEGNGPTTGTPVKVGVIVAGTNPYLLDLAAAEIAHVPSGEVPVLAEAKKRRKFTDSDQAYIKSLDLASLSRPFQRPKLSRLTALVTHKKLQKYFQKIRHAPLVGHFFDQGLGNRLLFSLGVTQEVMINHDMGQVTLSLDASKCVQCGACVNYCPMGKACPEENPKKCLLCLYCFSICPNNAILLNGKIGFFQEQLKQYNEAIRNLERTNGTV